MSFPENMKDEPAKVTPEPKITETSSLPIPMSNGIDPKPQESEYLHGLQLYLIFLALVIAVLLMMIDVSIVSTALPRITDTFNTIQDQVSDRPAILIVRLHKTSSLVGPRQDY